MLSNPPEEDAKMIRFEPRSSSESDVSAEKVMGTGEVVAGSVGPLYCFVSTIRGVGLTGLSSPEYSSHGLGTGSDCGLERPGWGL